MDVRTTTVFREIHKNTWLKRLSVDHRKVLIGPKKSERAWVVFCVHDDCEALLEGYVEPRQAAQHTPEWTVPLQHALHVSHSLVPSEHEYEFVITLPDEVVRFNAASWECMLEWVDTLRQKLREMKILSPKENLYSKLPELRPPLLPTRDPTSPLPATPPVPAALVPGIERIVTTAAATAAAAVVTTVASVSSATSGAAVETVAVVAGNSGQQSTHIVVVEPIAESNGPAQTTSNTSHPNNATATPTIASTSTVNATSTTITSTITTTSTTTTTASTTMSAMSNTLTQNLINMLSNPVVSAYANNSNGQQPSTSQHLEPNVSLEDSFFAEDDDDVDEHDESAAFALDIDNGHDVRLHNCDEHGEQPAREERPSMARVFADNVLADPNTCSAKKMGKATRTNAASRTIDAAETSSLDSIGSMSDVVFQTEPIIIPRPQTNRTPARDKASASSSKRRPSTNTVPSDIAATNSTTIATVTATASADPNAASSVPSAASNITIIQVSSPLVKTTATVAGDVFQFPSNSSGTTVAATPPITRIERADDQYKSNVQIIPSNPSAPKTVTIGGATTTNSNGSHTQTSAMPAKTHPQPVTTVQLTGGGNAPQVGQSTGSDGSSKRTNHATTLSATTTTKKPTSSAASSTSTTLVGNFDGAITNIPIGSNSNSNSGRQPSNTVRLQQQQQQQQKYEPLFISHPASSGCSSSSNNTTSSAQPASPKPVAKQRTHIATPTRRPLADLRDAVTINNGPSATSTTNGSATTNTAILHQPAATISAFGASNNNHMPTNISIDATATSSAASSSAAPTTSVPTTTNTTTPPPPATSSSSSTNATANTSSSKLVTTMRENLSSPLPAIRKLLTRGLTDMSITRPSRSRDVAQLPGSTAATGTGVAASRSVAAAAAATATPSRLARPSAGGPAAVAAAEAATHEQHRRRSSSHSEAQRGAGRTARERNHQQHNNNNNNNTGGEHGMHSQHPQQQQQRPLNMPKYSSLAGAVGSVAAVAGGGGGGGASANSRMTLREQQVLELRKEMMHLGGVRIQLRRKDCQGTIALCDAFGAVWVCGWKQKDHPMLYYALHIGDQVVQVAGVSVGCTADVNRIIRNVQGLYIDFILRRLPFGRVYAIRREMDGQCLGLIRDGNTATIVDVVPKSLSARHGLPPKAQSCDGLTLTFWVLTEINGRPLNLFFKDNEVRDRLNASGRDISVLVQPADLISKLKKHLKSMRGYKDYIVQ